jgi:hypothetical protein
MYLLRASWKYKSLQFNPFSANIQRSNIGKTAKECFLFLILILITYIHM